MFCLIERHFLPAAGTVAAGPDGMVEGGDGNAAFQARYILRKIQVAIEQLGGAMEDVVRTRIYVSERKHALEVAEVHGEFFQDIRPANTLVLAKLIDDEYLVEIEAEAIVGSRQAK